MLYGDDNDSKEIKNNKNKNGKFEINLKSQNNFSGEKGYKKMRQDVSQNGNKINNFKKNNKNIFDDFDELPKKAKENFMDKDDEDEKEISSMNRNNISISDDGSSDNNSSSISGKNKNKKKKKSSYQPNPRKKNRKPNYSNSFIDDEEF